MRNWWEESDEYCSNCQEDEVDDDNYDYIKQ